MIKLHVQHRQVGKRLHRLWAEWSGILESNDRLIMWKPMPLGFNLVMLRTPFIQPSRTYKAFLTNIFLHTGYGYMSFNPRIENLFSRLCPCKTIHHECLCRIEISHPRGRNFNQGRGLPSPWLNSDPEGEISLSYMDRLMMDRFSPTFSKFFCPDVKSPKNLKI